MADGDFAFKQSSALPRRWRAGREHCNGQHRTTISANHAVTRALIYESANGADYNSQRGVILVDVVPTFSVGYRTNLSTLSCLIK